MWILASLILGSGAVVSATRGPVAAATTNAVLAVPAGTIVTLVPNGTGGMANGHNIGDPIDFTVKDPVIVDGWVVIPKGAPAHGVVSDLTAPGMNGFTGHISMPSLHFRFEWVQLETGKIRLDQTPVEVKGRQIQRDIKAPLSGMRSHLNMGIDPFLTATEYGVDAKVASTIHIASTLRATALENAAITNNYIDK